MILYVRTAACVAALSAAAACGASGPTTSAPATSPSSATGATITGPGLRLSGAFSGTLEQGSAKCGLKEPVKFQPPITYMEITGTVAGKTFDVRIFDPKGPADAASGGYVLASEAGYYWIDETSNSIEAFNASSGATLLSTARPSVGAQYGNNPYGTLTITGDAVC